MAQQQLLLRRWVHRQFRNDNARLRCRESYARPLPPNFDSDGNGGGGGGGGTVLIPDGQFLRKYLRLLEGIVEQQHQQRRGQRLALVLLESAAELVDYRNASPSVAGEEAAEERQQQQQPEAAAPNERSRVGRLVERYGPPDVGAAAALAAEGDGASRGAVVVPFPDLSYRLGGNSDDGTDDEDDDGDDFDVLNLAEATVEVRARRALIRAGRIFSSGLEKDDDGRQILLLTDDSTVREELLQRPTEVARVRSVTAGELLQDLRTRKLLDDDQLQTFADLKKHCEEEYKSRNKPHAESSGAMSSEGGRVPYLTETEVESGLKEGKLLRGKLEVTKENVREGYVTASSSSLDIPGGGKNKSKRVKYYVNDRVGNFNRALHGDDVVIEVLPESMWGRPVGRRRLVHVQQRTDDDEDHDANDGGEDHDIPPVPSARVVALRGDGSGGGGGRGRRKYVATLQPPRSRQHGGVGAGGSDDSHALVVPMDPKIPKVRVRTRLGSERIANKRILIEVDGWDVGSNYPHGHYVRVIGDVGDLETEISCLLIEHGIDLTPFSASALACLPTVPPEWSIPDEEVRKRRDLRGTHRIFSVDPPGCQDIDDTMSATTLPNGDIEIGVHIADVTHFVPHNSALDREARVRSTTFYLVDRRFDMLPSLLSSDLCSLHGNVDRLAVSVIWTMSADLQTVKACWYGRTVIHNCAAMTYGQAHNILHDAPPDDPSSPTPPPLTAGAPVQPGLIPSLKQDLTILTKLARKLRKDREEIGGAVDLSSGDRGSELKFVLDENGNPTKVSAKKEMEIHHTIAEMMILANGYVASKIYEEFPATSLLRIHRPVEEDRFEELESTLKAGGMKFDGRSNMALAESLKNSKLGGKYGAIIDSLLQSLATRAMSEAQYICSGAQEEGVGLSHYGLGIDKYTHFTSPIRRYADVVVHRLLLAAVAGIGSRSSVARLKEKRVDRKALESLPDSKTMSVLGATDPSGDEELEGDELLDSLIEGAAEISLGKAEALETSAGQGEKSALDGNEIEEDASLYDTGQVEKICDRLNYQTRMAKLSSMDCQRLFLSLYFRNNIEVTPAVVIGMRVNGLLVYVPKFDLKGPVFLSDKDGNVQIDPSLVGLPPEAGLPPSSGFGILEQCRLFPDGKCLLDDMDDEKKRLDVIVPGSKEGLFFQPLDVVSVQLSCDTSDSVARIPPPRLHLVSMGQKAVKRDQGSGSTVSVTAQSVAQSQRAHRRKAETRDTARSTNEFKSKDEPESIFKVLSSLEIVPHLDIQPRFARGEKAPKAHGRVQSIPGRLVFGGFTNPDTLKATQDAATRSAAEAAAQRRAEHQYQQAIQGDYDASRRIEREATARMQRLAAVKRNARRSKHTS